MAADPFAVSVVSGWYHGNQRERVLAAARILFRHGSEHALIISGLEIAKR
jgi:hypothetical protein